MLSIPLEPAMRMNPADFAASFNREPFEFEHNLSELAIFSAEHLAALAQKYGGHPDDFFVAGSARAADADFYSVTRSELDPRAALDVLATTAQRILLKRPEKYDPAFYRLQQALFDRCIDPYGELRPTIERLNSSIFISSAAAITPFHFDPEITFFFQIEGSKIYHVYSPTSLHEPELEEFYRRGVLNIGQVDLAGRNAALESVFSLAAGKGLHQPQNAPHWVETLGERSISYAISLETSATRATGRARAFNHYSRRLGITPIQIGLNVKHDAVKAHAMEHYFAARRAARAMLGRRHNR